MEPLTTAAKALGHRLLDRRERITTAESCTGGWIAKCLTDIPGSSSWFDLGFVTYSNKAKHQLLGVDHQTLDTEGAVSEAVVVEMAKGAVQAAAADWSIAVSGIAGPTGGTATKPVGLVWLGASGPGIPGVSRRLLLTGNRNDVRQQATRTALKWMLDLMQ